MSKCEPLPPKVVALVIGDFDVAGPPQELLRTHKHYVYSCLLISGGKGKPSVGMGEGDVAARWRHFSQENSKRAHNSP